MLLSFITMGLETNDHHCWDPHMVKGIHPIEKVQRQAARFIMKDYRSRWEGCVTDMLNKLELQSLQQRREASRLVFFFKVVTGKIPSINEHDFVTKQRPKRHIKAKQF